MRLLLLIPTCFLLVARAAGAEVCMRNEGYLIGNSSRIGPTSPYCSIAMAFENVLLDFYGSRKYAESFHQYWAPLTLTISEKGAPMVKQNILIKIMSSEGAAEIRKEPEVFLTRMVQFEEEIKPYLCGDGGTSIFLHAGGVAEFNLRVAEAEPFSYLFKFDNSVVDIATVYLDKESCEVR